MQGVSAWQRLVFLKTHKYCLSMHTGMKSFFLKKRPGDVYGPWSGISFWWGTAENGSGEFLLPWYEIQGTGMITEGPWTCPLDRPFAFTIVLNYLFRIYGFMGKHKAARVWYPELSPYNWEFPVKILLFNYDAEIVCRSPPICDDYRRPRRGIPAADEW